MTLSNAAASVGAGMNDPLLTLQEAADYLRVPARTLYQWRHRQIGPRAFRVGKYLRYRLDDIDAWLEKNC